MDPRTVTGQLLAEQAEQVGDELSFRPDQTLLQDTTGATALLAFEATGAERVVTDCSVQYIDHQISPDTARGSTAELIRQNHRWLASACRRFGLWLSRPGNGISHVVHLERFSVPGGSLLGSDSHSCMHGALGMLAVGAGGTDVASAMAGVPYRLSPVKVRRIRLTGRRHPMVSPRDVGLEIVRRFGAAGGVGWVLEYDGPGLDDLDVTDRAVIAGLGAEVGATTSVFPADAAARAFLEAHGRGDLVRRLVPLPGATYEAEEELDLASVVPLVALPSSPGNVVAVTEAAGEAIVQGYLGSAGNPGFADVATAAALVSGGRVANGVRFDVNLPSARIEDALERVGLLSAFVGAGGSLHPSGCDEYTRDTQAPPTGQLSVRTVNRNFPGRSGTPDDRVALASAQTVAASVLTGRITDPRGLRVDELPPEPVYPAVTEQGLVPPLSRSQARTVELDRGPNIVPLPVFDGPPASLRVPVALNVGDDVSTDEILPGGPDVQPYRTNIPRLSRFVYRDLDPGYLDRVDGWGDHAVVAGSNYGQGSSREHAAMAPRFLGLRVVLARSFARMHLRNLVNVGVVPVQLPAAVHTPQVGVEIVVHGLDRLGGGRRDVTVEAPAGTRPIPATVAVSDADLAVMLAGGVLAMARSRPDR